MAEDERNKFKIGSHVAYRLIGDEVVIVDSQSSEMVTLNSTASFIWMRVAEGMTLAEIEKVLAADFDVSRDEARTDIATFVEGMIGRGLILGQAPKLEAP